MENSERYTRRLFLGAGLAAAARAQQKKTYLYTGCYTQRGKGIGIYEVDAATGALTPAGTAQATNPSFLALHPSGKFLYAINESGGGAVTGFAVDPATGGLTALNTESTGDRGPAHISVEPEGKFVLAANYGGGSVAMLPIEADGKLKAASDVVKHSGPGGPNKQRQSASHAHMILPDLSGKWALSPDLGLDRVMIYRIDRAAGKLVASEPGVEAPGAGPRHLAFHPNGRFVYVINELNSTVSAFQWDSGNGSMKLVHTLATQPDWAAGTNYPAHVLVSPDGKFLYGSNRGRNSIAIFSLNGSTGRMTWSGEQWTYGQAPRNFNLDPSGRFLYVGNQDTDNIAIFQVDRRKGRLRQTGKMLSAGQPVCFVFWKG